jgi:ABC-type transporter Mla subunit MlaD
MRSRRSRRQSGVFRHPLLIGVLTVVITVVAFILAFNANNGLPFAQHYTLKVQVRDASELTHGADVDIGGTLVGDVATVRAARDASGQPVAVFDTKLDESIKPLPVNSRFTIRMKGSLGIKYLQITPGNAKRGFANGATVPLSQTGSEVDLDQALSTFNPATSRGLTDTVLGVSTGAAGRGSDLNDGIEALVPLFGDLGPVARNLSSSQTDLAGFVRGLRNFAGTLAPVADTGATLASNLDTTFRPLAQVAVPHLQEAISRTPPVADAVISGTPALRLFLSKATTLFGDLEPGVATLPQSAPVLADAFAAGAHNLPATAQLDERLVSLSRRLESYTQNPAVQQGLDRLTLTASSLEAPLSYLTPAQASCNYLTLLVRNLASTTSENVSSGTTLRLLPIVIDDVPGGESEPSSRPYLTPGKPGDSHGPLHADLYPNTDAPGQTPECSAGNEPFSVKHALVGNPPGNVGLSTEQTSRSGG